MEASLLCTKKEEEKTRHRTRPNRNSQSRTRKNIPIYNFKVRVDVRSLVAIFPQKKKRNKQNIIGWRKQGKICASRCLMARLHAAAAGVPGRRSTKNETHLQLRNNSKSKTTGFSLCSVFSSPDTETVRADSPSPSAPVVRGIVMENFPRITFCVQRTNKWEEQSSHFPRNLFIASSKHLLNDCQSQFANAEQYKNELKNRRRRKRRGHAGARWLHPEAQNIKRQFPHFPRRPASFNLNLSSLVGFWFRKMRSAKWRAQSRYIVLRVAEKSPSSRSWYLKNKL